ncbi:hypothetical protein [Amycolatopsis orientalis]|uniref:hypothetical protein n=1 Tax=Amycolatopsis orientalis TaxID=31958 RepID=UPI000AA2F7EF|nr:hypothetical protein [Amycolatopsis orientalis]
MSKHPRLTNGGDRMEVVKAWAVVVGVCLAIAALGPIFLLSLIDMVGRWIR